MDPMAEKYYGVSPYAYCAGNPVNRIDATGMAWFYSEDDGHFIIKTDTEDDTIYMLSSKQETRAVKNIRLFNLCQDDRNSFSQRYKTLSEETLTTVITDLYSKANKTFEGGKDEYVEQVDLSITGLKNARASAETNVTTIKYNNGTRISMVHNMVVNPAMISTGYGAILIIAHEIGHQLHVADGGYTFSSLSQKERFADEFAMNHWPFFLASEKERKALIQHYLYYK